ncbi:hypothetical protein HMPREF0293_0490 [Corynebacterium glucuronolyticum ATCC 51866]|uniref:Uncharacterized protein n=1 Tax=Corynebacterium glucuronolyticum ATCC 51866 TaxID=548478 RepID=A0ABM9XS84_9CORY|nr:hypothetical protein HMPREF0293_0490 [Corynebacterium glucuronolyticum ATCC 51866]
MRRYFQREHGRSSRVTLFSAHAEVFPRLTDAELDALPLLRACGGISIEDLENKIEQGSSPRMRRYFRPFGSPGR